MTTDERRAIAFVALLLVLAAGARVARRDPPVEWAGEVNADSLAAEARARLEEAERRSRPLAPGERIDPNTASEEELDRLPGVGPALARRIVAAREEGGPFRSLEDLTRVRGIGPSALKRLAPHLELPPGPPPAADLVAPFGSPVVAELAGAGAVAPPSARGSSRGAHGSSPGAHASPAGARGSAAGARGSAAGARGSQAGVRGSQAGARGSPARAGRSAPATAPLDLNRATAAELETLPGVGPALAARIVAYRDSVGRFRDVSELARVRGIGPATLDRLRPLVQVRP